MLSNDKTNIDFKVIEHNQIAKSKEVVICRMLKTVRTATDESGIKTIERKAGEIYSIFPALAQELINAGLAEKHNPVEPAEKKEGAANVAKRKRTNNSRKR